MHAPAGTRDGVGRDEAAERKQTLDPAGPAAASLPRAEGRAGAQTEASRPGYAPATKTERFAPVTLNVGPEAFTLFSRRTFCGT